MREELISKRVRDDAQGKGQVTIKKGNTDNNIQLQDVGMEEEEEEQQQEKEGDNKEKRMVRGLR